MHGKDGVCATHGLTPNAVCAGAPGIAGPEFRVFFVELVNKVVQKVEDGCLPKPMHDAIFLQWDNASIHHAIVVQAAVETLEFCRCILRVANERMQELKGVQPLVNLPRVHAVQQPPYSPFLQPVEYAFGQ